jgi:rhodanese-related sulfurtransferase
MRRRTTPLALLLAAILAIGLVGCTSDSQPSESDVEALLTQTGRVDVSQAEAQAIMGKLTSLVIFDVRTQAEYAEGHVPNAYNLSYDAANFALSLTGLSQAASYLTYGSNGDDFRAGAAADAMVQSGIARVYVLEGGLDDWKGDVTKA